MRKLFFVFIACLGLGLFTGCQTTTQVQFHPITEQTKQFAVKRGNSWYGPVKTVKSKKGFTDVNQLVNINLQLIGM